MRRVISYYPLTDEFKQRIRAISSIPVEFSVISVLRNQGLFSTIREIRRMSAAEILVAIQDESARPLAGPLLLVAAMTGSRKVLLMEPDGRLEDVPRGSIFVHLARITSAQFLGRLAYRRSLGQIRRMNSTPSLRNEVPLGADAVLYLDANLSFGVAAGGSLGHTKGVIDGLVHWGFSVDYASVKQIPTDIAATLWKKMPAPNLYSFPSELNYYTFNQQYERRIQKLAGEGNYAFLYQRMSLHNFSGARLRKQLRLPLVLEYNGSEAWAWANWGNRLKLHDAAIAEEQAALRNADVVVTVSNVLGEEVAAAGVPRERIVVYPNCVDPEIFDPARFSNADRQSLRDRLGIAHDARVATFIGTFGVWHGVDFLARAIRHLLDHDKKWLETSKLHFLLVGDGLKMPEVQEILRDADTSSVVTLTGLIPQKEAPAYLAASDIFLSPHMPNADGSAFFGSPTKLFEYMSMQRPIVASDLDQIGDVLRKTDLTPTDSVGIALAQLYVPGDQEGFINALRCVVDHPEQAAEMAHNAKIVAMERYTWRHHIGAVLECMTRLGIDRQRGTKATRV